MNNPYSAPRDDMHALFVTSRRAFAEQKLNELAQRYSQDEIRSQLAADSGPIVDEIKSSTDSFARRTENVEFVTALGLSDFYFGNDAETIISFEMRRGFSGIVTSYDDLIQNIESATHIDCAITYQGEIRHFQIKRYPQEYMQHTNEAFLDYFDTEIIPHYPNMTGTTLIVILQPHPPYTQTAFNFPDLHRSLAERSGQITFDEVSFDYTDFSNNVQTSVLHQLHPRYEISRISLEQMLQRMRGEL